MDDGREEGSKDMNEGRKECLLDVSPNVIFRWRFYLGFNRFVL